MKTFKTIIIFLVAILFAACDKPVSMPVEETATGSLFGYTVETGTEVGIPGAIVTIPSLEKSTTADEDGFFYFANLEAKEYIVQASAEGYAETKVMVEVEANEESGYYIELDKLTAYGSIKGSVWEKDTYQDIAGATITIEALNRSTTTDKNGEFNFANVAPGEYTLSISVEGYKSAYTFDGYNRVTVKSGEEASISFIMIKEGTSTPEATTANLIGTVVDIETNQVISGAKITVNPGNLTTYSNNSGYYEFEDLKIGQYTITASADYYADVEDNVELTSAGANIKIQMTKTVVEDYSSAIVESFDNKLKCDIISCRRSGSKVEFKFKFTSVGFGDISQFTLLGSYGDYTIIYDNLGNQYEKQAMSLGNQSDNGYGSVRVPLLEYVGCNGSISIENVPANAETLTIKLCVSGYDPATGNLFTYEHISIRNLPIY